MPNGNNITKKQHYIPQTFLRGFSNDGKMICCYDLIKKTERIVPIQSILYREYLYEIRNQEGEICFPNQIENYLSQIEKQFSHYRSRLETSVRCEHNYHSNCFLNRSEKEFWIFYVYLQMIRHEQSINLVATDFYNNMGFPNQTSAKNAALLSIFSLFQNPSMLNHPIHPLYSMLKNTAFIVWYDKTGSLFTNEKAGCFISTDKIYKGLKQWKFVIFPISRYICIQMYNMEVSENQQLLKGKRNILHRLDKENLQFMKQSIANYADKMILSSAPLSQNDKIMLAEMQKNKQ